VFVHVTLPPAKKPMPHLGLLSLLPPHSLQAVVLAVNMFS
jgi:hypothetical protein